MIKYIYLNYSSAAGAAAKRQLGFAGGLRRNQYTVPLTGTAVEVAGFPSGGEIL